MNLRVRIGIGISAVLLVLAGSSSSVFVRAHEAAIAAELDLGGGLVGRSSPTLVDIDGNGDLEIIVGTENGLVHAIDYNGVSLSKRWTINTSPEFGTATSILSKPGVADLDGNGKLDLVISVGESVEQPENGGIIVYTNLDTTPTKMPGWPKLTSDYYPVNPYTDGVIASPALGDLDGDGDLEIVAGAFDRRVYAWHHDGTAVNGFPLLLIHTAWASASLADIDQDGKLEIILPTDVGQYESGSWSCPYPIIPSRPQNYCGGTLYVFEDDGSVKPGFPIYTYEMMQSSPAIIDLDNDGWLDIVAGTGTFYSNYYLGQGYPSYANYVYAWDHNGNNLPGWPVRPGGTAQLPGSPAIGDITGDGVPEVVIPTKDGNIYAYTSNGQLLSGFPKKPIEQFGGAGVFDVHNGIVLGDYESSKAGMEIFVPVAWEVEVLDGNGSQLTTNEFYSNWLIGNTPAVGDLDNDNKLELVVAGSHYVGNPSNATNGYVYIYELPNSSAAAEWPQFRRSATNLGRVLHLNASASSITLVHQYDDSIDPTGSITLSTGGVSTTWSVSGGLPANVDISPTSGPLPGVQSIPFTIAASSYLTGTHNLGTVTLQADLVDDLTGNDTVSFLVRLIVGDIREIYLPITLRD